MKFNDNIYYYLPMKKFVPGGHSSTVFIVKDENLSKKKGENSNINQYMIEIGVSAGRWGKKNIKKMESDGIDIRNTKAIFGTHAHQDHITGIKFYLNAIDNHGNVPGSFNTPVYFIDEWKKVMEDPDYADQYFFEQMGIKGEWKKDLWGSQPIIGLLFRLLWGKRSFLNNVVGVKEGDKFPLGDDSSLEVIFTPGHAPEHTSYLLNGADGRNVLFSGDLISFKENTEGEIFSIASLNNPASLYEAELETLKKLMGRDIDVLFTSHYGFFEGKALIRSYLESALIRVIKLKDTILDELSRESLTIKELTKRTITEKWLSGYAARTSSIYTVLKHLMENNEVEGDTKTRLFKLKNNNG
jgi:glyoxylase-like metal-dependent hydrolase (beta-lactamase superfamily II)